MQPPRTSNPYSTYRPQNNRKGYHPRSKAARRYKLRNRVISGILVAFVITVGIYSVVRWVASDVEGPIAATDENAAVQEELPAVPEVPEEQPGGELSTPEASATDAPAPEPTVAPLEHYKTDTGYQDDRMTFEISRHEIDSEGSTVVYFVADIVLRDMDAMRGAFSGTGDTISRNTYEAPSELASRNGALLTINCDNAGYNSDGIIVRNGTLYRFKPSDREMLMIFGDGTMDVVWEKDFHDQDEFVSMMQERDLIHSFSFGPGLVYGGKGRGDYSDSVLKPRNPRTAIGMVEPGHFKWVVVDGRSTTSAGLTLSQLEYLMLELGCTEAYNFDGGQSSIMIYDGQRQNVIADRTTERPVTDILYLTSGSNQ